MLTTKGDSGYFKSQNNPNDICHWIWQYSCLENPMDGGAWWAWRAVVHRVTKSQTQPSDLTTLRLRDPFFCQQQIFFPQWFFVQNTMEWKTAFIAHSEIVLVDIVLIRPFIYKGLEDL